LDSVDCVAHFVQAPSRRQQCDVEGTKTLSGSKEQGDRYAVRVGAASIGIDAKF
jgi:hypothetical protein